MTEKERSRLFFSEEETNEGPFQVTSSRPPLRFSSEKMSDDSSFQTKTEKAAGDLNKFRTNRPKKKMRTTYRESAGETQVRLHFEEKPKPTPPSPSAGIMGLSLSEVHRQIGKVEEENTGVEAAHHGEEAAEKAARFAEHSYRSHQLKPYR